MASEVRLKAVHFANRWPRPGKVNELTNRLTIEDPAGSDHEGYDLTYYPDEQVVRAVGRRSGEVCLYPAASCAMTPIKDQPAKKPAKKPPQRAKA